MLSLRLVLDDHILQPQLESTPSPLLLEQSESCIVDYGCDANDSQKKDPYSNIPVDSCIVNAKRGAVPLITDEVETPNFECMEHGYNSPATTISPSTDCFREESVSYSSPSASSTLSINGWIHKMEECAEDIAMARHGYSDMGVICNTLQGM